MIGLTTHISFDLPTHAWDVQWPIKKNFSFRFTRKLLITEILKRHLLVGKKVPYNFQMTLHENCWPFMPQTDDLCFSHSMATYSNGYSSENGQCGIFLIFAKLSQIHWHLYANFWVKILNIQHSRISQIFWYVQKSQKNWHLMAYETANWWHIQKSKQRCVEDPRLHLWTDAWWNRSMPSTLWAAANVSKNHLKTEPLDSKPCQSSQVSRTPPKMVPPYSPWTCPPKTPKPHQTVITPSSRKKLIFWDPYILA